MKLILFCVILFASYPLMANNGKLPKHFDMETIKLNHIPYGENIEIDALVTIPNPHKDRVQAKAFRIYEKIDGQWVKSAVLDATPQTFAKNKLQIKGKVKLMSDKSDVAIDSTIIHCGKYCVINNFQGVTKRSTKVHSKLISFNMKGYLPTDKIKNN